MDLNTPDDLTTRLRQALLLDGHAGAQGVLEPLRDKGLAHDHVRLVGSGLLARIPKQSQMDLSAEDNLAYQRACFERAAASGHTPALHGWLPPSQALPRGALLVQEIVGRPAHLPADLGAIAASLASLHALPLPDTALRAPLRDTPDPLRALCDEIAVQARYLEPAGLVPGVARTIHIEWQRLLSLAEGTARPSRHLIAFDGHPGNFIVQADGRTMLVDLEKCRYGYPGLDLAHATLYTSTTWDLETSAELTPAQVLVFHGAWARAVGTVADEAQAWHLPLRRAMWLWSVTWCAKWRVTSGARARAVPDGEDWSSEHSEATLVAHVRGRVDHYLSPAVVSWVREEFATLEHLMGAA